MKFFHTLSNYYDLGPLRRKDRLFFFWIALEPLRYFRDAFQLPRKYRNLLKESNVGNIKEQIGFLQVSLPSELVNECIARSRDLPKIRKSGDRKEYFSAISSFEDYDATSPEFKLASHPSLLSTIYSYFGVFPYITSIGVYWSSNTNTSLDSDNFDGSQLFHRDAEDRKIVKVWILCNSVDENSGPTVLIPYQESEKIARIIRYRQGHRIARHLENEISSGIPEATKIFATGTAGTVFLTDTARLLHYGSRTIGGSERLVLMFSYETFYSQRLRRILNLGISEKDTPKKLVREWKTLNSLQKSLLRAFRD